MYQLGRIDRVEGKLSDAEAKFRQVNQAYPRDR
jgi:TolA-binding protein